MENHKKSERVFVEPLYLSVKTAAARYSVSESTIREMLILPDKPKIKRLGKKVLVLTKDFDRFFAEHLT